MMLIYSSKRRELDAEGHCHPLIKTIILMILFISDGNMDWPRMFTLCHEHINIGRWESFVRKLFGK